MATPKTSLLLGLLATTLMAIPAPEVFAAPDKASSKTEDTSSQKKKHKHKKKFDKNSSQESAADSASSSTSTADDEKVLRAQNDDYIKMYAAGDATGLARLWTENGTYTDPEGHELKGRTAIEQYFVSGFKHGCAGPLELNTESIRFPAGNVAIEEGTCRATRGRAAGSLTRYTVIHVKENGQWLVAAVTESNSSDAKADSLKDLGWLVGNWTAKGPKGTMHFRANWAGDNKFIHCVFKPENAGPNVGEVEVLGWNPILQRIVAWHFDSKGGFGYGKFLKDGDAWVESAAGVEADGTAGSSVNTLRKLNDNSFSWRSTGRRLGGHPMADTDEITVTRDAEAK
jgi:uncharacterized protein (TIGR02246 family)